jgi:hypothetical protein
MTHALKVWKEYYQSLVDGSKTFELRKHDRPFQVGDKLILQEYNQIDSKYTGKEIEKTITYTLFNASIFGLKEGYCILGIKDIENY